MKFVRTVRRYRALVLDRDEESGEPTRVVSGKPIEVSDADADRAVKLGREYGVEVIAEDVSEDGDAAGDADGGTDATATATPDLSAGVGAITGGGDAVTNDQGGVVTDGDANEPASGTSRTAKTTRK